MRPGDDLRSYGPRPLRTERRSGSRLLNIVGGTAVAIVTLACGAAVYAHVLATPDEDVRSFAALQTNTPSQPSRAANPDAGLAAADFSDRFNLANFDERFAPAMAAKPGPREIAIATILRGSAAAARGATIALLDPRPTMGRDTTFTTRVGAAPAAAPSIIAVTKARVDAPAAVSPEMAASKLLVPMPAARPSDVRLASLPDAPLPARRETAAARTDAAKADGWRPDPAKAEPNIIQKLFGLGSVGNALAYAPADGGVTSDGQPSLPGRYGRYDRFTAVYDISAKTVYLPDGTKLEAHSGLGPKMDDIRHVHVKMQGPTPPHLYDLTPREKLFHGVEALRMHPVGGAEAIHGRTGLLTHSYLLGPNGQSNGCVSFRDYDKFLNAYKNGQIRRIAVVASLD